MNLITSRPVGHTLIRVLQGDLTLAETDAIVNAANTRLQHGGGVAAAIVRRGGRIIQDESNLAGLVPTGQVYVTTGGALRAKHVIHTVGPHGSDPDADQKLESAVTEALREAGERGLATIALPAISSGIFGFPKDRCAEILLHTALQYLQDHPQGPLVQIDFVLLDDETTAFFRDTLSSLAPR